MNEQMNKRMYVWTNERKSENYIPPHTSYVGGIIYIIQNPSILIIEYDRKRSNFDTTSLYNII